MLTIDFCTTCRGPTNTEPGAVATGVYEDGFIVIVDSTKGDLSSQVRPVATAPGSVFVDPQCKWTKSWFLSCWLPSFAINKHLRRNSQHLNLIRLHSGFAN
jgi:hypothetical protein